MTITPLPRQDGALQQFQPPPIPDHIAGGDEAAYIAICLEWRRSQMAGKEAMNDRQLVEGWLADCTPTQSVETVKTHRRHIERLRAFLRGWNEALRWSSATKRSWPLATRKPSKPSPVAPRACGHEGRKRQAPDGCLDLQRRGGCDQQLLPLGSQTVAPIPVCPSRQSRLACS